jgi:hypothetical protein
MGKEMPSPDLDASLRDMAQKLNNLFQITLSAGVHLQETWQGEKVPEELTDIQEAARRGAVLTGDLQNLARSGRDGDVVPEDSEL